VSSTAGSLATRRRHPSGRAPDSFCVGLVPGVNARLADRLARHAGQLRQLSLSDRGASAVEYSLIAVFIAAVIVAVVTVLGNQVSVDFNSVIGK